MRDRDWVPPEGESSRQAGTRLGEFLAGLADTPRPAAVVTHGGITLDLLRNLLGDDGVPPPVLAAGVPPCAVTTVDDLSFVMMASVAHPDDQGLPGEGFHGQLVVLPDAAVPAEDEEDAGGPGDTATGSCQLDSEGDDAVMAGHVAGRSDGVPAAGHELLVGMGDPGVEFLVPPELGELRSVPAVAAAAITSVVSAGESAAWLQGALGELHATLTAKDVPAGGPAGGIYADEVFTRHRGQVTIFVPCARPILPTGRVAPAQIPAAELAVIEHSGPPADVDRAYGTLGTYVARHALAVDGPIREYYLVGQRDTPDTSRWRTEIGWPVFRTRSA